MIYDKLKLISSQLGDNRLKFDVETSELLETRLGGKAAGVYIATTQNELIESINLSNELKIPYIIIGSGSKTALKSGVYEGLVIKNRSSHIRIFGIKGKVSKDGLKLSSAYIEADSGVSLGKLIEFADKQWLSGLDSLKNIPGTIGGNLSINRDIQEKADHIKVMEKDGTITDKLPLEVKRDDTIISVTFSLKSQDAK